MSDAIPLEAQELIRQFKKEERLKAEQRALFKKPKIETQKVPHQLTTKDAESMATRFGCRVERGNGRHGKHIIAPNGEHIPLPDHGGGKSLSTGVRKNIVKFFKAYGTGK